MAFTRRRSTRLAQQPQSIRRDDTDSDTDTDPDSSDELQAGKIAEKSSSKADDEGSSRPPSTNTHKKLKRRDFTVIRWRTPNFRAGQRSLQSYDFESSLNTVRLDPSTLCLPEFIDKRIKRVFYTTTTYYWPLYRTYLPDAKSAIVDTWLERTREQKVLYHAVIAGHGTMIMSSDVNASWGEYLPFIRKHSSVALKEMRNLAADGRVQATDEMINAAQYLSMTARPRDSRYGREGGLGFGLFDPPMRKLQAINTFGETYWAEPHVSGVRGMVKQRGGLDALKMMGLAEAVQTHDFHCAASTFDTPELSLSTTAEAFIKTVTLPERKEWLSDREKATFPGVGGISVTSKDLPTDLGFDSLTPRLPQELLELLYDMRIYTTHVRNHVSGDMSPGTRDLAMQRNLIVYRLLCLPNYDALPASPVYDGYSMAELIRLAAALYVYGVLYPTPRWTPKQICVDLLRRRLRKLVTKRDINRRGLDGLTDTQTRALLWVCTIGCMMAAGPDVFEPTKDGGSDSDREMSSQQQDLYLKILAWCRARLRLDEVQLEDEDGDNQGIDGSWEGIKQELERWLWMPEACDDGGELVWRLVWQDGGDDERLRYL